MRLNDGFPQDLSGNDSAQGFLTTQRRKGRREETFALSALASLREAFSGQSLETVKNFDQGIPSGAHPKITRFLIAHSALRGNENAPQVEPERRFLDWEENGVFLSSAESRSKRNLG